MRIFIICRLKIIPLTGWFLLLPCAASRICRNFSERFTAFSHREGAPVFFYAAWVSGQFREFPWKPDAVRSFEATFRGFEERVKRLSGPLSEALITATLGSWRVGKEGFNARNQEMSDATFRALAFLRSHIPGAEKRFDRAEHGIRVELLGQRLANEAAPHR